MWMLALAAVAGLLIPEFPSPKPLPKEVGYSEFLSNLDKVCALRVGSRPRHGAGIRAWPRGCPCFSPLGLVKLRWLAPSSPGLAHSTTCWRLSAAPSNDNAPSIW